jgi:glycosyltransferase involved in cell wall biosynthesis
LAEDWGIDVSIEGFAKVHDRMPEARYIIIGNNEGLYAQYLYSLVSKLGLSNSVFFLGSKRYEELPYYLTEADIGVALNRPNELRRYAVPLKVVEYMAAGLAIVGTGTGETEKLILDGQCGRCVPFSSDAFASAALDILRDNVVLTSYIEHAKEYAKRYDWDSLASGLVDEMNAAALLRDGKAQL